MRRTTAAVARLVPADARLPLAFALGAVLLAAGGALLNERAAAWLMREEAEAAARAWASDLDHSLGGDLASLLAREPLPEAARATLARSRRRVGEVFRYRLFDSEGRLVLASDDLQRPEGVEEALARHRGGSAIAAAAAAAGGSRVEAARGVPPHRPAHHAEARVPVHRQGRAIGVAEVHVDQTGRRLLYRRVFFAVEAAVAALVLLAGLPPAMAAWRRARQGRAAEAEVRFLAMHDALTGLPNRAHFAGALSAALSRRRDGGRGGEVGVIAIDLDRFKEVNDGLGHAAGDALLQAVAARLRAELREGDAVARLGGDEFAVALSGGAAQADSAARLAERLVEALSEPFDLPGGHRAVCGASAGVAAAPTDAGEPGALLRAAEAALHRSKADGRGVVRRFQPGMDAALAARRHLTQDLRAATAEGGFDLDYQPLRRLSDGALVGFEALLRWPRGARGMVPPSDFVPIAEETGLILPIGAWALRRACADAAAWPGELKVAVNLSPVQFRRGADLVAVVRGALAASGLPPGRLELEITEGLLLRDTEAALQTLTELRALGCSIAMDDFGTGYSSLGYLWRFPFDKLKIDRSFVLGMGADPKAAAIVSSVVALGRALGLTVTAEGVETAEQAASLREAGCAQGQGFLLGRPARTPALAARFLPAAAPDGPGGATAPGPAAP